MGRSGNLGKLVDQLFFQSYEDGVYLTVHPSLRGRLNIEDVKQNILGKGVVNANFQCIKHVLDEASGKETLIGDHFIKYNEEKDKFIHLRPSENGLQLLLSVRYSDEIDLEITIDDIKYCIWRANVKVEIDEEKIELIVKEKRSIFNEVIAEGEPSVPGTNTEIIFVVDTKISSTPLIRDDGSVDYRRVNLIKCVEKDQLLAYKIPCKSGKPGINIFGDLIPFTPGKEKSLPRGMNTYISTDELNLYSKCHGHIYFKNGLLHVEQIYIVNRDVDFSTGDIHYQGEVIINGDVKTGFTVETDNDIIVKGNVDGATLISHEGSIEIQGGILGKNRAEIRAKKGVSADFIQFSKIESGGYIKVNKFILHSDVQAYGTIYIPNGNVIGGSLNSNKGVIVREIGAPNNLKTKVGVFRCVDPSNWIEAVKINKKVKLLYSEKEKIEKQINFLEMLRIKLKQLDSQKEQELSGLQEKLINVKEKIQELEKRKQSILDSGDEICEEPPFIQANYKVHPGVVIAMSHFEEEVKANLRAVRYLLKETGIEKRIG